MGYKRINIDMSEIEISNKINSYSIILLTDESLSLRNNIIYLNKINVEIDFNDLEKIDEDFELYECEQTNTLIYFDIRDSNNYNCKRTTEEINMW